MSFKSAISVVALAAGLVAGPALAQTLPTTIGGQAVIEADAGAVKARCDELNVAKDTQSLTTEASEDKAEEPAVAGDASINSVPTADGATTVGAAFDLSVVTLADCEADGWLNP